MKARCGVRANGVLRILCACLFGCAGCVSFDATEARRGQTESFTNELARLESELLARPLSLEDCVAIAMTNNYEVRKADLDAQLGRFSRDMAFSAFLLTVYGMNKEERFFPMRPSYSVGIPSRSIF